jgi:hypothetical protein
MGRSAPPRSRQSSRAPQLIAKADSEWETDGARMGPDSKRSAGV